MKMVALSISNACIAFCGGLIAQYQSFADINSGVGILVVGLASVIIGEAFFGHRSLMIGFISAIVGSIVYRYIIALATKPGLYAETDFSYHCYNRPGCSGHQSENGQ